MQTDDSTNAPPDAIRWAQNLFAARVTEPKKSIVQRILAVLQMDLSPNKAASGERSASASKARQMLFQAGENAVDIRISPSESGFKLHGQILGAGFANAFVRIGEFETTADETSEFKFANVPGGRYDLSFQSGEKEIIIQNIRVND